MTNYESEIMLILAGETPKQKYDFLVKNLKILNKENNLPTETVLINVLHDLKKRGKDLYNSLGSESYTERCAIYDAEQKIFALTNKRLINELSYVQWNESVERTISEKNKH